MKPCRFYLISAAVFLLFAISLPETTLAITRTVDPSASTCDSTSLTSPCYRTISAALTAAVSGDTIEIHPGTYTGTIALTKNLTITGTETARTILSGGGSGPIITIDGLTSVTIRKLSFTNSTTGILIKNSSSVTITNSVFRVGTTGTAVDIQSSSTAVVENNTFYQNQNAIAFPSGTTVTIINNIFSNNTGIAVSTTATAASIHYNCFYGNSANGQTGTDSPTTNVTTDPLFVDANEGDFHLRSGSPCSHTGDSAVGSNSIDGFATPDMGAYGGPNADTIPFRISDLAIAAVGVDSISLSWSVNQCYQIGGYNVYYGDASGDYTTTLADVGTVAGNTVTYTITGLASATAPTGAPVLTNDIANQTLLLSWNTTGVSGATGYEVRYEMDGPTVANACPYATVPTSASPTVDVENITGYALTGLVNNTCYSVNIAPYALATYFIVVKSFYASNTSFVSAASNEEHADVGSKEYDLTASNVIHDYPEFITPNPNLPSGGGCFIATAAYGDSSAPQVRILREFRDRYLLTNAPGRAFVRWYYEYGPIAAEFVNAHPWLKPIVRTALLPTVGGAFFATRTSGSMKILLFVVLGLSILCVILKLRNYRSSLHPPRTLR